MVSPALISSKLKLDSEQTCNHVFDPCSHFSHLDGPNSFFLLESSASIRKMDSDLRETLK
jgi:hypothetical protein